MTNMKMAKKDLALVMIIVGALLLFCAWKFSFSPAMEEVDAQESKQADLQVQIDKVVAEAGTETQKENEIKQWSDEISKMLSKYDVYYQYEDGILWMKQIEDDFAKDDEMTTVIAQYTVGESGIAATVEGQGAFAERIYYKGTTTYTFNYQVADYATLKDFIDYIVSGNDGVKTIDNMSFSVDPVTGVTSGSVTMTVYTMMDGTVAYEAPTISGVETGVTNIFGEPTGEEEDAKKDK